jgi:glycogen debranching enzyme
MTRHQTRVRRATPADPMPGIAPGESRPSSESRNLAPELGPNALAVTEGRTFMYSDCAGDVPPDSIGGLVSEDTRLLGRWQLTIQGRSLLTLQSGLVEPYWAAFFLTNPTLPGLRANSLGVRRLRLLGEGMRERIEVQSFAPDATDIEVRLSVGTDFADLFEIKDVVRDRSAEIAREHDPDGSRLVFRYANAGFEVGTEVRAYPAASEVDGDDLVWRVTLSPGRPWHCQLDVPLRRQPYQVREPRSFGDQTRPPATDPLIVWRDEMPRVQSDWHTVEEVIRQCVADLSALRMDLQLPDERIHLPAAGLPWFLTLFGRDTLITAYQTLGFGPGLAYGALVSLAQLQGRKCDDFRDEEPGRILHEVRNGELTLVGQMPHNPYYGSADSTPLWLILLSEYWRWTGDDDLVRSLRPAAVAALQWIDRYGDRDGDGYVEYQTKTPHGLGNQCWRDSWDGVQTADGLIPPLPIATCETQGYVYDAKLRAAELCDGPWRDPGQARALREEAATLRDRFNADFWIEERGGYYAIGLDGDKRVIDSLTSNIGHLLWSGIVPEDRAPAVVDRLMSDELFSGWGVRTLSTMDAGYNPIGYHTGTVWPHDNSIIAAGLTRYGYRAEANRIAMAQIEAAPFFGNRLPEAMSGYPRDYATFPIPYPTACSPQAWATCAPLLFGRSILAMDASGGEVRVNPDLPEVVGRMRIDGLVAFNQRWDIEAIGRNGYVRLAR